MGEGGGRSGIQRLLMAVSATLVVLGLLSVTSVAYGVYRVRRVPQVAVADVLSRLEPPTRLQGGDEQAREEAEAVEDEARAPSPPFNVLLVGDSSRRFVRSGEDERSFGRDPGAGSDSIVLVRIDPAAGTAATLPFPRDLYVELADGSGTMRINRAYELGGARLLIRTIRARFDVPVHHYVQVDFEGFRGLIDAVGGITIALDAPVRDFDRSPASFGRNQSGLDIPTAGCVELDGDQALAYVRSRHFEQLIDGEWVADGRSDFTRSERQQQLLRQVLAKSLSERLLSPERILDLLEVVDDSITLSDDLDVEEIADLALDLRRISPDAFADFALPVTDLVTPAGAQVLEVSAEEAEPILDVFRGVGAPAASTSSTTSPAGGVPPAGSATTEPPAPTTTDPPAPVTTLPPAPLC